MVEMVKRAGILALVFVMMVSSFVQAAEIGVSDDFYMIGGAAVSGDDIIWCDSP